MLNKRKNEKSNCSTTTLKLEHYFPSEKQSKTFIYNSSTSNVPFSNEDSSKSNNLILLDKEINKINNFTKNNKNDSNVKIDYKLVNQSDSLTVDNSLSKDSSKKRILETPSYKCNSNKKTEKASKMTKFFVKVKRANLLNDDIEFNSTNSNSNTNSEIINKMNSDQYINAIKNLNFVAFERKLGQTRSNVIGEHSNNSNFTNKIQYEERKNDLISINENSFHSINNSSNIKILNENEGGDLLRHSKNYKMKEVPSSFEGVLSRINGQQIFSQKLSRKRQRFSSVEKLNEEEEDRNKNLNHQEIQKIFMDSFNQNSKSILEYNSDYDNFDSLRMPFREKDYYNTETILDSNHFLNDNEENELKFL